MVPRERRAPKGVKRSRHVPNRQVARHNAASATRKVRQPGVGVTRHGAATALPTSEAASGEPRGRASGTLHHRQSSLSLHAPKTPHVRWAGCWPSAARAVIGGDFGAVAAPVLVMRGHTKVCDAAGLVCPADTGLAWPACPPRSCCGLCSRAFRSQAHPAPYSRYPAGSFDVPRVGPRQQMATSAANMRRCDRNVKDMLSRGREARGWH